MNKRLSFVLLVGVAMLLLTAVAGWLRRSPPSPVSALAPSAKPASKPGAALPPNAGSPPLQAFASGYVASLARELRTELANDHPDLLPALDALTRPDVGARAEAIQALGFAEEPRLVPLIASVLASDPEPEVRASAAASLDIHNTSPAASLALIHALDDPAETVRDDALLSLKVHRNEMVETELRRKVKAGGMASETAEDVKLFLDRHYVRKDPFQDPLAP